MIEMTFDWGFDCCCRLTYLQTRRHTYEGWVRVKVRVRVRVRYLPPDASPHVRGVVARRGKRQEEVEVALFGRPPLHLLGHGPEVLRVQEVGGVLDHLATTTTKTKTRGQ